LLNTHIETVIIENHVFVRIPAGLPGWPFLGQISEIRPRFKLVGLKKFVWPFLASWSWLALKIRLAFWLFFGLFTIEMRQWCWGSGRALMIPA